MPPTSTTTGNDVLELAYSKLMDVSPENIATEDSELLLLINRSVDGLFAVAARVNPWFFGSVATVSYETDLGWLRPADAESVYRIESTGGVEVAIVPFEQRNIEPGMPSVYLFGQYYRSTETDLGPEGGDLLIYYSKLPTPLASLSNTVDAFWPEQFNELLGVEVAIHLALKAGQQEEVASLKADRDQWLARYLAFLQHETAGKRGWATTRTLPPAAMAMLAGGA